MNGSGAVSRQLVMRADWHSLQFTTGLTLPRNLPPDADELFIISPEPGIRTGVAMGPVRVTIVKAVHGFDRIAQGWEDIAQVEVQLGEDVVLQGPMDDPVIILSGCAGSHLLRVSAKGRRIAYDLAVDEPVEDYRLEFLRPTEPRQLDGS